MQRDALPRVLRPTQIAAGRHSANDCFANGRSVSIGVIVLSMPLRKNAHDCGILRGRHDGIWLWLERLGRLWLFALRGLWTPTHINHQFVLICINLVTSQYIDHLEIQRLVEFLEWNDRRWLANQRSFVCIFENPAVRVAPWRLCFFRLALKLIVQLAIIWLVAVKAIIKQFGRHILLKSLFKIAVSVGNHDCRPKVTTTG